MATHRSICRSCSNRCAILVDVDDGQVTRIAGDRDDPVYGGYTCVKGRSQGVLLHSPERLLHSLKRTADGDYVPIPIADAVAEIATRLVDIRSRNGPRAIAGFSGHFRGGLDGPELVYEELFDLLDSEMRFTPNTIDKGGKQIAAACHGRWMAPSQGFDEPEVAFLIGANPLLTYTGFPAGNPHRWLTESLRRGMRLIVLDPRRTEVARKATVHLQARPGHDPHVLAAMLHVILTEELQDQAFLDDNVDGVAALLRTVRSFTPARVGRLAGVEPDAIVAAARTFATAGRGYAFAGTGPSMAGTGSLTEYLVMALETVCGHWLRAGEPVVAVPTLLPVPVYKAQAGPPQPWIVGEQLRVRSLYRTVSGMPTAALSDEILLPGPGQVRALICWGGNPAVSFPDQLSTIAALKSLELLVQVDPWMSATARLADYVIAPTMPLEVPANTVIRDRPNAAVRATGYGSGTSYANYSRAIVDPPPDSDLVEEWRFFQALFEHIRPALIAAGEDVPPVPSGVLARSTEELLDVISHGSRVPLDEVRRQTGGQLYPSDVVVADKDPGWTGRLDVGNAEMLALLEATDAKLSAAPVDDRYPLRMLCRRVNHVYNSVPNVTGADGGRTYNPTFVNPDDLYDLGLEPGQLVSIESSVASIPAIVEADPTMARGTIAQAFGFGGGPETDHLVRLIGSAPNRLIADDEVFDPFMGQPQMSNVPVRIIARDE